MTRFTLWRWLSMLVMWATACAPLATPLATSIAPTAPVPVSTNTPTLPSTNAPDEPINSMTPITPAPNAYDPQPTDKTWARGNAFVNSKDVLVLESYPPQFVLALEGSLPTPCHQLRAVVTKDEAAKHINVEVYTVVDPNMMCIQVLKGFSVNIPLGSFTETYTLTVNGEAAGELKP